jgi:hypothetical protein
MYLDEISTSLFFGTESVSLAFLQVKNNATVLKTVVKSSLLLHLRSLLSNK